MTESALRPQSSQQQTLPPVLRSFLLLLAGLTAACLLLEAFWGWVLRRPYPYNWPLARLKTAFTDLVVHQQRFGFYHSAAFFHQPGYYMYPAPLSVFYQLFYVSGHPRFAFIVCFCVLLAGSAWLLARALVRRGLAVFPSAVFVAVVAACSYPFFFCLQQGNLELIVWVFVAGGIAAFASRHTYLAAACFGVAAAMKIFPLIFIGLLLSRRLYRHILVLFLSGIAATIATLWGLCPNIATAWRGTQEGLAASRQLFMLENSGVGNDHSLFSFVKAVGILLHPVARPPMTMGFGFATLSRCLAIYLPLTAVAGIVIYFLVIRKLPVINQVICLTVASILLPPLSYNYTLIHLYAPWALLVLCALERRERPAPGLAASFICFALLFAPESEIIFRGHPFSGQIKAIVLCLLLLIALRRPFHSSFDEQLPGDARQSAAPLPPSRGEMPLAQPLVTPGWKPVTGQRIFRRA